MNPKYLKKWRIAMGNTQEEMAEILHVSESSYIKYENGQRNVPEAIKEMLKERWLLQLEDLDYDIESQIDLFTKKQKCFIKNLMQPEFIKLKDFLKKELWEMEEWTEGYLEYGVGEDEIWCESFRMMLQHAKILMFQGNQKAEGTVILWDGESFAKGYNYYEPFIDGGYVTNFKQYQQIEKKEVEKILKENQGEFHTIERSILSLTLYSKKDYYELLTNIKPNE